MAENGADLQPESLWRHFFALCRIPRCSGNEAAVRAYVLGVAARHGLASRTDRTGNAVVVKAASPGREASPLVTLQSHLDMVCEKNRDTVHDFARDPVRWVLTGGWVKAEGTTLGADNGIGVAAALALMESRDVRHGPLEFLFTVDEESGLTGAFGLGDGMLEGRVLINLDSEEEGTITVGCAGGLYTDLHLDFGTDPAPPGHTLVRLRLGGCFGGHSGLDIHLGRANPIRLLARFLLEAAGSLDLRVACLDGGNKPNAIPRECDALVYLPEASRAALDKTAGERHRLLQEEYRTTDPGIGLKVDPAAAPGPFQVLRRQDQTRLLELLRDLPHGVLATSPDVAGMVETSTNLAIVRSEAGKTTIRTKQRSSSREALGQATAGIGEHGENAGAEVVRGGQYPPWPPVPASPLLGLAKGVYRSLFGKEPRAQTVHAGLECGIIGDRFPGMDMISFGPTIQAPHSPEERVETRSVERFWDFLAAVLERLGAA